MEICMPNKDEINLELKKLKADDFLFVRYKGELTGDTEAVAQDIVTYCQEVGTPCLVIPANDEEFYLELSQWDAVQLRKLVDRIQSEIQRKSKIILE